MGMTDIAIKICNSIEEAPNYKALGGYKGASIDQCVIVRNGMESGRSTVDLVFRDENGTQYVAMVSGRILRSISAAVGDEN